MPIATVNPANGETVKTFTPHDDAQIETRLQVAVDAFRMWKRVPFADRAAGMMRAAEILEEESENFARIMALEMGKLLQAANDEAKKCARCCRFYAENAERFLADEPVATSAKHSFIKYQPLGPVLAIMPWNFPFWQVFRFAAPGIMAGNIGLLKHASNVPQCALAIEDIFRRAGFPKGVFQTLLIEPEATGRVIDDPRVAAVTLTGSEGAGRKVAEQAGRKLKKTVLELGGSDPFIVMPSTDLNLAVETAVKARNVNSGQSCIAAKRFIVAEAIADEFERKFVDAMASLRVGDPIEPSTDVGPLATYAILTGLDDQLRASVSAGARVLTGGGRIERPGFFYSPTVLTDIPKGSPAYKEELFGPVASMFRVPKIDEAIRLANDTRFGLGSSAWTADPVEESKFVDELEAGLVFINGMVASDPAMPFGGVKNSGYGRELGVVGIREFVNIKTVWVQ